MHSTEEKNSNIKSKYSYEKIMTWVIKGIGLFLFVSYTGLFAYMAYIFYQYPEVTLTFPAYYFPLLFISCMFKGMFIMIMISWDYGSKKDESRKGDI